MAIGIGAAQAEVGSHWNIAGKAITGDQPIGATLENSHGQLLSKALGVSLNILCTGMTLEEFVLKTSGGSLGRAKFSGCKILLNGVVSAPCEPHTGSEKGVILTNLLKDLIVLHGGQPVDQLEPETGTVFVLVSTGDECSVGASIPIIGGRITVKDCKNEGQVEKVEHLVEELAALTDLWVISKTVEHIASLDGSANIFLTGANAGKLWSATPA